jgi:hypothetical protein
MEIEMDDERKNVVRGKVRVRRIEDGREFDSIADALRAVWPNMDPSRLANWNSVFSQAIRSKRPFKGFRWERI